MRVRISDIPHDGLSVDALLPVDHLNQRMGEGRNNDIVFLEDPKVEALITRTRTGATFKGELTTSYKQPCARCTDEQEQQLSVTANLVFHELLGDEAEPDADVGVYFYRDGAIELEEIIQEQLILELEPFWYPKECENGDCETCGKNFKQKDEEQGEGGKVLLKDLLQKAGVE